jgi:hypothetical protein
MPRSPINPELRISFIRYCRVSKASVRGHESLLPPDTCLRHASTVRRSEGDEQPSSSAYQCPASAGGTSPCEVHRCEVVFPCHL